MLRNTSGPKCPKIHPRHSTLLMTMPLRGWQKLNAFFTNEPNRSVCDSRLWRWEDRVISVIRKIQAWQLEQIILHFQIDLNFSPTWNLRAFRGTQLHPTRDLLWEMWNLHNMKCCMICRYVSKLQGDKNLRVTFHERTSPLPEYWKCRKKMLTNANWSKTAVCCCSSWSVQIPMALFKGKKRWSQLFSL